ncbi:MAG: lytic transglycosylase [Bacteroidetes bacterium]|nr:lytic transglycosylase [Bacteroidota bacterium]
MFKTKFITFLIVLFSFPAILVAQTTDETIFFKEFERNYDSLLTGFYMRQNSRVINSYGDFNPRISAASTPDSVFARRLRKLPSAIKLTYNKNVRGIIEYYIDRIGDRTSVMIGLSNYYFPIFESILDQHNAPHELKYLAVIESALNPNAVSRVGATGLWQFMYPTGRMYDLRVNSIVDDRKDPIKASVAAAKYLRDLNRIYNDWELALAAYNCGPGNVNKAIRRSGKNTFWEIYDYLPRETRGYVPAYIAAAYVMNYYKEHGLTPTILSKPTATDTVMVAKDVHFQQISEVLNIPIGQIKDLNPQYKQNQILGTQDRYSLKLPINYVRYYVSLEDSIANYSKDKYFQPEWKQKHYVYKQTTLTHKVRKKESWASIARRYGVNASDLRKWNKGGKKPIAGRTLKINKRVAVEVDETELNTTSPFTETTAQEIDNSNTKNTEEISSESSEENNNNIEEVEEKPIKKTSKPSKKEANAKKPTIKKEEPRKKEVVYVETTNQDEETNTYSNNKSSKKNPKKETLKEKKVTKGKKHTVRKGESLYSIAKKNGVSVDDLIEANNLKKKNPVIKAGQTLIIK